MIGLIELVPDRYSVSLFCLFEVKEKTGLGWVFFLGNPVDYWTIQSKVHLWK